jgi:hypothetical protein
MKVFSKLEGEFLALFEAQKKQVLASDVHTLESGLAALDSVSDSITERVSTSRVLAGIVGSSVATIIDTWRSDDSHHVHSCTLQTGCIDALAQASISGWQLGVLSINWCPDLINAMLLRHIQHKVGTACDTIPCWSNHVDSDGRITLAVPGALAKRKRIEAIQAEEGSSVVYVGDSVTDLPALLAADLGVLVGSSSSVREFASKYNVRLEPLSSLNNASGNSSAAQRTVWAAESWAEIDRMVIQNPEFWDSL